MALLTEARLRQEFGDITAPAITCYDVPAGTLVTPSARTWLIERRIDLRIGDKLVIATPRAGADEAHPSAPAPQPAPAQTPTNPAQPASALPAFTAPAHFDVIDGSQIESKPDHLTALRGNLLVPKNHPQIRFRGQLDALEADLLVLQVEFDRLGLPKAVADLGEVLRYVKQLLRAEVLEVGFEQVTLFGYDDAELRHRSHHPQQYYGINHFATSLADGAAVVLLNQLRTKVREVELAGYDAFAQPGTAPPTRVDLIRALNRLSSAVYLMMFKAKTGEYQ
jgi:ethanolamine utilization cobalamin adenosyltransferase